MLIITWNLAGRVKRLSEQAKLLLDLHPDVLCLQELTPSTIPVWMEVLGDAGYHKRVACAPGRPCARPLFVLTAAREPLQTIAVASVPWPERVLAIGIANDVEVVNVHSPISPKPNLAKVRTHEAVFAHLAKKAPRRLRVLCGDLNTPRKEHPDGRVWTFARDQYGRLRPERGGRWDRAELSLIRGLGPYGFRDAYRSVRGYEQRELSWEWPRWKGGYRLDHLLLSGPWQPTSCCYLHQLRTSGLSDHSPLRVDLQPAPTATQDHRAVQRSASARKSRPISATAKS
jgi:exonuclease III